MEKDVLQAFEAQLDAMKRGDTNTLDRLLDGDFTLTHITGYRQPKAEWLSQMRAGQFRYHDIETRSVQVDLQGDKARLVGRLVTDATVYGSRAAWRLQLRVDYRLVDGQWFADMSIATTW